MIGTELGNCVVRCDCWSWFFLGPRVLWWMVGVVRAVILVCVESANSTEMFKNAFKTSDVRRIVDGELNEGGNGRLDIRMMISRAEKDVSCEEDNCIVAESLIRDRLMIRSMRCLSRRRAMGLQNTNV